ncbi:gamma-glutamylcyclotransferase family protein [Streptomyces lavendulae]|uniref:gamma-glutamylcyclotransferase family protein n=1 Tax=Streptomyces lavendulae TaxID=1914 RepID=UPI0024A2EBCE|nr:gamma-glutamylcyclotransferase [Streptomyces roseochromogenus]
MDIQAATSLLFTYGTLQLPKVQLERFGRLLEGEPDALPGYRVTHVRIADPEVIAVSGSDLHPVVTASAAPDVVEGTVLRVTEAELAAADDCEVDAYVRSRVALRSGRAAGVYLGTRVPRPRGAARAKAA